MKAIASITFDDCLAVHDIKVIYASGQFDVIENTYVEMFELLPRLIAGDTNAIYGDYPNGRSCIRQFIHEMINANSKADR